VALDAIRDKKKVTQIAAQDELHANHVATNGVEGKRLGKGVGVAAATGATIGTAGKIAADKLSPAASGLVGALGANAKTAVNAAAKVVTGEVKKETQCTVKNNGNAC
jgi:hypothetical protein